MAAIAGQIVGQAVGETAKTVGSIAKAAADTFLNPLGNILNEPYEQRKREQEAKIEQEKLGFESRLKEGMEKLKNQLDIKLLNAKSDEERKTLFADYEAKKNQYLLEWNKNLEFKQQEWAREDKQIFRAWALEDIDREERDKLRDQLKYLIYTAPDSATKASYAQILASTFGKGKLNTTIPQVLHVHGGALDPYKINNSTRTQNYIKELENPVLNEQQKIELVNRNFKTPVVESAQLPREDLIYYDEELNKLKTKKNKKPYKKHE